MTLAEIIKSKVDELYETYNSLNQEKDKKNIESLKNEINKLNTLISLLSKEFKNLKDLNYQDISNYISLKEQDLKNVQLVLKAKYDANLPVNLTATQLELIKNILKELKDKQELLIKTVKEEEEKINNNKEEVSKIEESILNLEYIHEKVTNEDDYSLLNLEEFKNLSIIFDDKNTSSKLKIDLLKSIIEYNENIENHNKKIVTTTSIEEVKECFRSFNFKEDMFSYIDKNKEEISRNIDLSNTKEILEYLDSKHILDKFSKGALLTIVLYSNKNTISKRYEDLKEHKALFTSLFEMPSIWVNKLPKRVRHNLPSKNRGENGNNHRLRSYANMISYEEMHSNEEYLTSLGLNVSISNKTNIRALQTPSERIEENYNICKQYGFFEVRDISTFPPSVFSFNKLADKCDKLVEVGLLHNFDNNYAVTHPSITQLINEATFSLLYKLKRENTNEKYYQIISSKTRKGALDCCITNKSFNKSIIFGYDFGTKDKIETFKQENFINQKDDKYIPNANEYEEIITKENPITYQDDILTDEKIKVLEEQYRVDNNPYQYKIGNEIISRLKVLRCYSALKEHGIDDDNALLYSVTRGMYLDENTFNLIKTSVKGRGEYDNELSNKI